MPARPAPSLEIRLFGRFVVRVDGVAVDDRHWARRSAQALVKLLALASPHTLHREQVTERLWPGQAPQAGLNSLNKAIHAARRALEPELARGTQSLFILTPGNQIVLSSPGTLQVDMHSFEAAAHQAVRAQNPGAAREALALYGGLLLIDDLYEPWSQARRSQMQQLFRSTTIAAARLFVQRRQPGPGLEIARRLLLDDPADEVAHVLLMQLHACAGQREMALQQFELGRAALAASGVEPGPALQALAQQLRAPSAADLAPARLSPGAVTGDGQDTALAWSPNVLPVTYRSGVVKMARLLPDGESVLVCANWDDNRFGLHRLRVADTDAGCLSWPDARLLAISPAGDKVLGLRPQRRNIAVDLCTLAVVPAAGGVPVELLPSVQAADWHPLVPGATVNQPLQALAVVREQDGQSGLEFPVGTQRFCTGGWISRLRFSPDGRHLAFIHHPVEHDDSGDIQVIDLTSPNGAARALTGSFLRVQGLAWRDGQVWFTATRKGLACSLYRVGLQGGEQLVFQGPGNLTLHDAEPSGRLLVSAQRQSIGMIGRHATDPAERDISWHDYTTPRDISADGRTLLVEEGYTAGRHSFAAYLRGLDGKSTRLLADSVPLVMSPDGGTVILREPAARSRLSVLDLASGAMKHLPDDEANPIVHSEFVSFFPDGRRIVFAASDPTLGARIYVQDLADGLPVCLHPHAPGLRMPWNRAVSPDGTRMVLLGQDDRLCIAPVETGGALQALPLRGAEFRVTAWNDSGQALFVHRLEGMPSRVYRYWLDTGELQEWMSLAPASAGTVGGIHRLRMTADGRSYAYCFFSESSDLYLFDDA